MKNILYPVIVLTAMIFSVSCKSRPGLPLNQDASVKPTDTLPENPLLLHAITSGIHLQDSTMFTLYANEPAFSYAASHTDNQYPAGAVLYEVTWRQQADEQWIGANIPKNIMTVERVAYTANVQTSYSLYQGTPLKKVTSSDPATRITIISGRRMAVSP